MLTESIRSEDSIVPTGLKRDCETNPSDKSLGYYQTSLRDKCLPRVLMRGTG